MNAKPLDSFDKDCRQDLVQPLRGRTNEPTILNRAHCALGASMSWFHLDHMVSDGSMRLFEQVYR